jgi:hypothetical protein
MEIDEMMLHISNIKIKLENEYMVNREVAILKTKLEDLSIYFAHYNERHACTKRHKGEV